MSILTKFCLDGKNALVTGAAGGIAGALSKGLADAGANVVLADLNLKGAQSLANEIAEQYGVKTWALEVDTTDGQSIEKMAKDAIAAAGRIHILIPAAGISKPSPVEEMNEAEFDQTIAINLRGVALCSKYVGRHMLAEGGGSIINIGSLGTERALGPGSLSYVASKGAVGMMTKSLANDWADRGVRVNGLIPGYFRTNLLNPLLERDGDGGASRLAKIPMGRWGEVEDLVGATVFLASEASAYITGHLIAVDGGYLCR